MKKRIFALLLAGLLAASMTSCFQGTSDPQDTNPQQTLPETNPSETDPDAPIIFTEVDETVYTLSDNVRLLTEMDSVVGAVVIKTKVTEMRRKVACLASAIDSGITIHDFRMVTGPSHTNLIFDIVLPLDSHLSPKEAAAAIEKAVTVLDEHGPCYAVVTVDRPMV